MKRLVENRMILGGKRVAITAVENCPRCHGRGIEGINPVDRRLVLCRCATSKDHGEASDRESSYGMWREVIKETVAQ